MKLSVMLNYAGDIKGTADEVSALEKVGLDCVVEHHAELHERPFRRMRSETLRPAAVGRPFAVTRGPTCETVRHSSTLSRWATGGPSPLPVPL